MAHVTRRRAPRLLIGALVSLAACGPPQRRAAGTPRCLDCHAVHHAETGSCVSCHRGDPGATRPALAHRGLLDGALAAHAWPQGEVVTRGRALIELAACRRCHAIGGEGQKVAVALDRVAWSREPAALRASIREPVDNMPDFGFAARETDSVIAALLSLAPPAAAADPSYRVWFTAEAEREPGAFEQHCGGCHRLLTADGPHGVSAAGPNLSGLFSPFHPKTAANDRAWTPEALRRWLDNPRAVRPATPMPRPKLEAREIDEILDTLGAPAPTGG